MNRQLSVGIMSAQEIHFSLDSDYLFLGQAYKGDYVAKAQDGKVLFEGHLYDELLFSATDPHTDEQNPHADEGQHLTYSKEQHQFTLRGVTIGVNFHWQRQEDQTFVGDLRIIAGHDKVLNADAGLIAINCLDVEDYLASVISSEMSATSSFELLKAHAVISRSWLLHPIIETEKLKVLTIGRAVQSSKTTKDSILNQTDDSERIIRWYERDAHSLFDVCADDHCQRYQGITRKTSDNVQLAIDETRGEVLVSNDNGEVCDARFYKSCGGVTEEFENCWADEHYSYLEAVSDSDKPLDIDLTEEAAAREFILSAPPAYCNTHDARILSQVLNNYDQETQDFYRWKVTYTQKELSELVHRRSGIDFGTITDLIPVRRGPSARLYELKIVGTKRTVVVGKELEIRKWLSSSHLYSSAFVVEKTTNDADETYFTLHGAGWGHGVGLCQIGAAVMADQGIGYKDILAHYFPNTSLTSC